MKPITHMTLDPRMTVNELVLQMKNAGVFGAGRIAKAADVMETMFNDKECTIFIGQAGAMVPGGMKNVLIDLISNHADAFVCTGATLTHDLVEALGHKHYQGKQDADDKELHKKGIDRMYDSYMPNEVYESMEKLFKENFDLFKEETTIKGFLWKLGSLIKTKDSILRICFEKKIPIFCPAISDSGIGLMIWGRLAAGKKINVNAFEDLKEIISMAWDAKRNGVIYIGGGVPKNFIQQAMQFGKQASYGVQITTDRPEWGGSSGAELREGISWGKMEPDAKNVDVFCDATIALPLIYGAVKERLNKAYSKSH